LRASVDGDLVRWRLDANLTGRRLPPEFVFCELWDLEVPERPDELTEEQTNSMIEFCNRFGPLPAPYRPGDHTTADSATRLRDLDDVATNTTDDVRCWLLDLKDSARYLADVQHATEEQHLRHLAVLDLGLRNCPWGARTTASAPSNDCDLVTVAALMLHAITVGLDPVNRCAHTTCGRPFVHQRLPGHDQRGHLRTKGVMYCTPKCARAAAQRAYKQRTRTRLSGNVTPSSNSGAPQTDKGQQ
jgi:hypothetical protein